MKKCTAGREVVIRWYNEKQKQWFLELLHAIYGTLRNARRMERGHASTHNTFNLFCNRIGKSIVEAAPLWWRFGKAQKEDFLEEIREMNRNHKESRTKCDYLFKLYEKKERSAGKQG